MPNCLTLLTQFVRVRASQSPDGRPLCAYRCTSDEFQTIGEFVRRHCEGHTRWKDLPPSAGPLFCLYAAEWWRRNHVGGAWRWEDILRSAGLEALPLQELYSVVQLGLKYWKRPLLLNNGSRMFLVTLACEGGLPLQLLTNDFGSLRSYFRELLEQFEQYRGAGFAPERLAEMASFRLPRTLRQPVVFQISGALVDAVWTRRRIVKDASDPLGALDAKDPLWRDDLPLSLDDEVAQALLRNLVNDASQVVRHASARLRIVRELVKSQDGYRLRASLDLPGWVSEVGLRARMRGDVPELGNRFELFVTLPTGGSNLLALATRREQGGQAGFLVERPRRETFRAHDGDAAGAVGVEIRSGTDVVAALEVDGTSTLTELPWVFADRRGDGLRYRLVGTGSLRTRYPAVLIAVPSSSDAQPMEEGEVREAGALRGHERRIFLARGSVSVLDGDERCEIGAGAETDDIPEYKLTGETISYRVEEGITAYRGWPYLLRHSGGDPTAQIALPDLEVRRVGEREWSPFSPGQWGMFDLRLVEDGALRFRARTAVLPAGFSVSFRTHAGGQRGEVLLSGAESATVNWAPIEGVRIEVSMGEEDGGVRLSCHAVGQPPADVRIVLSWDGGSPIGLSLPFPCSGGRFIRAGGKPLVNYAEVALDEIGTVRATAISPHASERFSVRGQLRAYDISEALARNVWVEAPLRSAGEGRFELSLGVLREPLRQMLACTKDLGAEIRLTIDGVTVGQQVLAVRRFAFRFLRSDIAGEIWVDTEGRRGIEGDEPGDLVVDVRPLWRPSDEPVMLQPIRSEGMALGGWLLPPTIHEQGPWLVSGWQDDLCKVQPQVAEMGSLPSVELVDSPDVPLTEIVRIRDRSTRHSLLESKLRALAEAPDHTDWETVYTYLRNYRGFPPSTLDLVEVLADTPCSAALTLMRAGESDFDSIWETLEDLPFAWWGVTLDDWVSAARSLYERYLQQFAVLEEGAEPMAYSAFEVFFRRSAEMADFMKVVSEAIHAGAFGRAAPQLGMAGTPQGRQILFGQREQARQELVRSRADEQWPQAHGVMEWKENATDISEVHRSLWLQPPKGTGFRSPVLNAPVVAALCSVLGDRPDQKLLFELKTLRAFDTRWFDEAYRATLAVATGSSWMHRD